MEETLDIGQKLNVFCDKNLQNSSESSRNFNDFEEFSKILKHFLRNFPVQK